MPRQRLIDVSELEAPEPFEAIISLVDTLEPGEYICMRHRKQPLPLIEILHQRGFTSRIRPGSESKWEIIIWDTQDKLVNDFCSKHFS